MIHVQLVAALSVSPPWQGISTQFTAMSFIFTMHISCVFPAYLYGKLISHTLCMHIGPTWLKRLLFNKLPHARSLLNSLCVSKFSKNIPLSAIFPKNTELVSHPQQKTISKLENPWFQHYSNVVEMIPLSWKYYQYFLVISLAEILLPYPSILPEDLCSEAKYLCVLPIPKTRQSIKIA